MMVGALAAELAEQGKLDLRAPISRYVPELADKRVGTVTMPKGAFSVPSLLVVASRSMRFMAPQPWAMRRRLSALKRASRAYAASYYTSPVRVHAPLPSKQSLHSCK